MDERLITTTTPAADAPAVVVRPVGSIAIATVDQGTPGTSPWLVTTGFMIGAYDYISLSYTGANLTTVVYKTGGAGGATVATLTLAYSGSTLISVTKT